MKNNISPHISYREATRSNTATRRKISNIPDENELRAMILVAEMVFEPVRVHFNKRIRVNSFFRSKLLNKIIGGSKTSQHCSGEALDLDGLDGLRNSEIFFYIKHNLEFDQLIWEFGTDKEPDWVHVSFNSDGENRGIVLKAVNGSPTYRIWK
jgi:hypothetical protein